MFDAWVTKLSQLLPDFGVHLAGDGKAIHSHARPRKAADKDAPPSAPGAGAAKADGRRDLDANMGLKTYRGQDQSGTPWEKVTKWFGYKMHLVADATYELPVAFTLTKASASEVIEMRDALLPKLAQDHPELVDRCQAAMFDRGYDDTAMITQLDEEHDIAPIIGIRDCWQDGKTTRAVPGQANVHYDFQGNVTCRSRVDGRQYPMAYGGYEKDRHPRGRTSIVARRDTTDRRAPRSGNAPSAPAADRCASN
jgi:hypothetical protein